MKRWAFAVLIVCTSSAAHAQSKDAEIITSGFQFNELAGIMRATGEVKNNTSKDLDNVAVTIDFKRTRTTVDTVRIRIGKIKAGEQIKIDKRIEAVKGRWNNWTMSWTENGEPLFWRLPKN